MSKIVTVVYEKGVLRPLRPLKLRESQRVRIQLLPDEPVSGRLSDDVKDVVNGLIAAGLMHAPAERDVIPPDPLSTEERKALAARLGRAPGKLISEMVIEDRGER
jgi:predicted DNA-binding antitoxin AbrB/MazE fold protein